MATRHQVKHDTFTIVMYSILALMLAFVLVTAVIGLMEETNEPGPPYGCTYLDMNPSKSYAPQLACVEGYGWSE